MEDNFNWKSFLPKFWGLSHILTKVSHYLPPTFIYLNCPTPPPSQCPFLGCFTEWKMIFSNLLCTKYWGCNSIWSHIKLCMGANLAHTWSASPCISEARLKQFADSIHTSPARYRACRTLMVRFSSLIGNVNVQ